MKTKGLTLLEIMIVVAIIGLVAAIAIPAATRLAEDVKADICRTNLSTIDKSKIQWAFDNNKSDTDEPTADDLEGYITGNVPKECVVAGALYDMGKVISPAMCNYHGDSLGNRPPHYGEDVYVFSFLYDEWIPIGHTYISGDANKDDLIDSNDYDIIDRNWIFKTEPATWEQGDFNNDGKIDSLDFDIIDESWRMYN